jgi:hypothetical protein
MSLTITQVPATASLGQSPIIFVVSEGGEVFNSSSFQYNCDLYYYDGTPSQSGSVEYTLVKYPNESGVGIFDVSKILNSTLTDLLEENPSNVKWFKSDFYTSFKSGSQFITSSKISTDTHLVLDGYSIFQEPILQQLNNKTPFFPILTDGPKTQSIFENNKGTFGVWVGKIPSASLQPTKAVYSSSFSDAEFPLSTSVSSSQQIFQIPIGPLEEQWPLPSGEREDPFNVQIFAGDTPLGQPIYFNTECKKKYPNVRIKWKNRYGQFDYFNFNMVSREGFNVTTRTYQPQIGSWNGSTFGYNGYDSSKLNYVSDSSQTLSVNTDWVSEDYNEIFKQLLVSDEIYWVYDEGEFEVDSKLRPITIRTESVIFKTGAVDKLIQYTFDFEWGQSYKLII